MAPLAPSRSAGEFWPRAASAVVIAVPVVAAIHFGFPYFELLVAVVAVALACEWSALCAGGRFDRSTGPVLILSSLGALAATAAGAPGFGLLAVAFGVALAYGVARAGGRKAAGLTALGALYVGLPCVALVWLRQETTYGRETVLWMVAVVVAMDIGGYVVGRAVGGPRLAPRVSPSKTWSGLAGGMMLAAAVGALMALAMDGRTPAGTGLPALAGASAVLALVSQGGDLLESAVKRRFGVKDMSAVIPGHGGVFDRVDGHLAAALAVAAAALLLGGDVPAWR